MSYRDCFFFYKRHLKKPIESGDLLENSEKLVENLEVFINTVGTADIFAGVIFIDLLELKDFSHEFFRENGPFDIYEIKKSLNRLYTRPQLCEETQVFITSTDSFKTKSRVKRCERCEKPGHSATRCVVPAEQCPNLKAMLTALSQENPRKNESKDESVNA